MNIFQKTLRNLAVKSGAFDFKTQQEVSEIIGASTGYAFGIQDDNKLIKEGYANNTDVYAIINLINSKASDIPFVLYEKTANGLDEVLEGGLYDVLQQPNPHQTQKEFREAYLGYLLNTGDRFLKGTTAFGFGDAFQEMEVLPSNITEVIIDNTTGLPVGYRVSINGKQKTYSLEEVYHGKYFNPTTMGLTSHRGLSPLQAGYRSLVASNELITAEASVYKNKGVSGILSSGDTNIMLTEKEAKDLQTNVIGRLGGASKVNGVTATTGNIKYTAIGMTPQDMGIFKSGDIKLRSLCRLYAVDSNLLGDPKASSFNNVTEANKKFYTNAVIPNNEYIITDYTKWLLPAWSKQEKKEYVLKQDLTGIEALQSNQKEEAEKNKVIADTITNVLSAPISDESKVATLLRVSDLSEESVRELFPIDNTGTGTEGNTGGNVQVQSLNGAQVTSMGLLTTQVRNGELPKQSAIQILMVSFGMTLEQAKAIIEPIEVVKPTSNEG